MTASLQMSSPPRLAVPDSAACTLKATPAPSATGPRGRERLDLRVTQAECTSQTDFGKERARDESEETRFPHSSSCSSSEQQCTACPEVNKAAKTGQ